MDQIPAWRVRSEERDGLFISAVFLLTALPYVFGLGFYMEDYAFLATLALAEDQSYGGLFSRLMESPNLVTRPIQPAYITALYKAFGPTPMPGHIFNHIFMLLGGLLFYAGLRVMRVPRLYCLALPLIFLTLPHYSTDRYWQSTYNIVLSMTFYFAVFYCSTRCAANPIVKMWPWLVGIGVFTVLSVVSYEIFLFLLFITPALTILPHFWRTGNDKPTERWRSLLYQLGVVAIALTATVAVKLNVHNGHRIWEGNFGEWLSAMGWLYRGVAGATLWHHGAKLPVNLMVLLKEHARVETLAAASGVFALTFAGLWPLSRKQASDVGAKSITLMFLLGLAIFIGSYLAFANNFQIGFSPTGTANRVHIAPAVGLALSALSAAILCGQFLRARFTRAGLPVLVAFGCAAGTLINTTLGIHWTQAARAQDLIITEILSTAPNPAKNTVILDGRSCIFIGPAPVFLSTWDLKAALKLHYASPTIRADIINSNIKIERENIAITEYDILNGKIPDGQMVIHNMRERRTWPIPDYEAALAYFAQHETVGANGCAPAYNGGIRLY